MDRGIPDERSDGGYAAKAVALGGEARMIAMRGRQKETQEFGAKRLNVEREREGVAPRRRAQRVEPMTARICGYIIQLHYL